MSDGKVRAADLAVGQRLALPVAKKIFEMREINHLRMRVEASSPPQAAEREPEPREGRCSPGAGLKSGAANNVTHVLTNMATGAAR